MAGQQDLTKFAVLSRTGRKVLPQWLAVQAQAAAGQGKPAAKNVLVVLEQGGLSHLDTWDPKSEAVAEHRSPFKPIATNVPGIQFTELLANTARVADKLAVVRSMRHPKAGANGHPDGTQYMPPSRPQPLQGCSS